MEPPSYNLLHTTVFIVWPGIIALDQKPVINYFIFVDIVEDHHRVLNMSALHFYIKHYSYPSLHTHGPFGLKLATLILTNYKDFKTKF